MNKRKLTVALLITLLALSGCRTKKPSDSSISIPSESESIKTSESIPSNETPSEDVSSSTDSSNPSEESSSTGNLISPDDSNSDENTAPIVPPIDNDKIDPDDLNTKEELKGEVTKQGAVNIISSSGLNEAAYIAFDQVNKITQYNYYIQGENYSEMTLLDDKVAYTRKLSSSQYRVDFTGLKPGNYTIKIDPITDENISPTEVSLTVDSYDISGYAHFNYTEGVGAYKDDGTLKDNAIVIYVTDENKNTVMDEIEEIQSSMFSVPNLNIKASGIGWWLNNTQYSKAESNTYTANGSKLGFDSLNDTHPIVIRIVGKVTAPDGLTVYDSTEQGGSTGDNGGMARMKNLKNVTIEGIGEDAIVEGWGFHFINTDTTGNRGKSFEVRNLTFTKYPEDAVGMEGVQEGGKLVSSVERCWIHHITFLPGYCANPAESDKAEGDGSCDFKRGQYYTMSYCYYEYCHKTNLLGASDDNLQFNVSFHHNIWYNCASRIPLTRKANVHFYNNYVYGDINDKTAALSYVHSIRGDAYIFSEGNYYEGCKGIIQDGEGDAKLYNNEYVACFNKTSIDDFITNDRTIKVSNNCKHGNIDYSSFDTDPNLFYYDVENQVSDCYITSATHARKYNLLNSGSYYRTLGNNTILKTTQKSNKYEVTGSVDLSSNTYTATLSSDKGIAYNNFSKGKFKGQGITFNLSDYAIVEIALSSENSQRMYDGFIVKDDGTVMLKNSGSVELSPGTYYVLSCTFDKETVISSLKFTKFNNEELDAERINQYNDLVTKIPQTITYDDSCYIAIDNAKDAYNQLNSSLQAKVDYSPVEKAYNSYLQAGKTFVENKINSIGIVTKDSLSLITQARNEYEKFIVLDSELEISNYQTLLDAEKAFESFEVQAVIDLINSLTNITLSSKQEIEDARNAYNALTEEKQQQVSNYSLLVAAENEYNDLLEVEKFNELYANYENVADMSTLDIEDLTNVNTLLSLYNEFSSTQIEKVNDTNKAKYNNLVSIKEYLEANLIVEEQLMLSTNFENDNRWNYTNTTGGSSTASVSNPVIIESTFTVTNLSKIEITIQSQDKGTTNYTVEYSTDGTTWNKLTSFKNASNGVNQTYSYELSSTLEEAVYVRIYITCTKGDSNAKSVSVSMFNLYGYSAPIA